MGLSLLLVMMLTFTWVLCFRKQQYLRKPSPFCVLGHDLLQRSPHPQCLDRTLVSPSLLLTTPNSYSLSHKWLSLLTNLYQMFANLTLPTYIQLFFPQTPKLGHTLEHMWALGAYALGLRTTPLNTHPWKLQILRRTTSLSHLTPHTPVLVALVYFSL